MQWVESETDATRHKRNPLIIINMFIGNQFSEVVSRNMELSFESRLFTFGTYFLFR